MAALYEHHRQPLLPRAAFLRRLALHSAAAASLIIGSLLIGMVGYHVTAGLPWVDAFLNAAMLLGGMGPVDALHDPGAKLFAGCYALYAGVVFLVVVGVVLAPIIHRCLHHFHAAEDEPAPNRSSRRKKAR